VAVRVTGGGWLEAAAARARYTALRAAPPVDRSPVLLGHTLADQPRGGFGLAVAQGRARWPP